MRRVLVALSLLPVFAVSLAVAQIGNARFSGKIIVPDPHFDGRIEVLLETTEVGGQTVTFTYTDSLGYYSFTNVPYGTYYIFAKLDGYQDVRERVTLQPFQGIFYPPVMNMILSRKPLEAEGAPSSADSNSIGIDELGRTYPKKAIESYSKGLEDIEKGNSGKAVEHLEAAVKLAPDFYDAHFNLGVAYERVYKIRDAEKAYRRAHDLRPLSARPLVSLGRLYVEEAESRSAAASDVVEAILGRARTALEEGAKLDSNSATAFYLLGVVNYKTGRYSDAGENLKRALALDNTMGPALIALANVYIRQREWQNALENLDRYLLENPAAPNRAEVAAARSTVVDQLRTEPQ